MSNVWLTADLHLGHLKICEMTGRPFGSVQEMNEALIENFNALVRPEDTVWFLGDVAMGQLAESLPLVARMHGHKFLVLGNHDRPSKLYHHKTPEKRAMFASMYAQYFAAQYEQAAFYPFGSEDPMFGSPCLLHHLPYRDPNFVDHAYEGRYEEHMPEDDGKTVLLHGHVHGAWKRKGPRMVNVGVDVWDYRPVHLDQIRELLRTPVE